jgi:hypothetical protein
MRSSSLNPDPPNPKPETPNPKQQVNEASVILSHGIKMFEESAKDGGEDAKGVKLRTRMQARLGEILARKAEAKNGAAAAQGGKPPAVPSRSPKNKVRRHLLGGHGPRHFSFLWVFLSGANGTIFFLVCALFASLSF